MNKINARFEICQADEVKTDHEYPSEVVLPKRGSSHSAGYDFTCPFDVEIKPHSQVIVPSYVKCLDMSEDKVLKLYVRSSLGIKRHLMLANGTGIIDSDYIWCIYVALFNFGDEPVKIEAGERFVQGIFEDYYVLSGDETDTERVGGIGSTGKK
jgi:dUTP pyrophosphatase